MNSHCMSCLFTALLLCMGCTGQKITKTYQSYAMQPAIYSSDWLVYRESADATYDYGDMLLFQANETDNHVFRVIGLPGDSVAMDQHISVINGKKCKRRVLSEDIVFYLLGSSRKATEVEEELPNGVKVRLYIEKEYRQEDIVSSFAPQRVPSGHYFLLGDTRTLSYDSRYQGAIPVDKISGKVTKVIHRGKQP